MLDIIWGGKPVTVTFNHIKRKGKGSRLKTHAPISAITICVVVTTSYVLTGVAVCEESDDFSRPIGRRLAFNNLVNNRGGSLLNNEVGLRQHIEDAIDELVKRPGLPQRIRHLSREEKEVMRNAGTGKRLDRAERRMYGKY